MSVSTKTVQGRRELRFQSFDDMVADVERLVSSPGTKTLGNWPLSRLLAHLSTAMNRSVDGIPGKAPWFIRAIGRLLKPRILKRGMSPGFNLPKAREGDFFPTVPSLDDAVAQFRKAVERVKHEKMTASHPVFGQLTHDEWFRLHLRHAEMHLSFAVPG